MPSYCCAVNCKNNGFTHPELSFFKFPENRKDITEKWIQAMRRLNWQPTKYSRLCSIHFEENCFFLKKGSRLRLLPDAIPTIFDFRKIKNNRKKAQEYLNMTEKDCPDPNLYQLETELVTVKSVKSGQNCRICQGLADSDITLDSVIATKKGKISLMDVISSLFPNKVLKDTFGFICIGCSQRMIDSYFLKLDVNNSSIFGNINEEVDCKINEKTYNYQMKPLTDSIKIESFSITNSESNRDKDDNSIAYCSTCDVNFLIQDISIHLIICKMKETVDRQSSPLVNRRLIICYFCRYLLYQHDADSHIFECSKINNNFDS